MDKSREQFQKWWEDFYETSPREPWSLIYSPEHDYYVDSDIDGQYDAWKASRDVIEIELPDGLTTREALHAGYTCDYAAGMDKGIEDCGKAVQSQGLKVKQ